MLVPILAEKHWLLKLHLRIITTDIVLSRSFGSIPERKTKKLSKIKTLQVWEPLSAQTFPLRQISCQRLLEPWVEGNLWLLPEWFDISKIHCGTFLSFLHPCLTYASPSRHGYVIRLGAPQGNGESYFHGYSYRSLFPCLLKL